MRLLLLWYRGRCSKCVSQSDVRLRPLLLFPSTSEQSPQTTSCPCSNSVPPHDGQYPPAGCALDCSSSDRIEISSSVSNTAAIAFCSFSPIQFIIVTFERAVAILLSRPLQVPHEVHRTLRTDQICLRSIRRSVIPPTFHRRDLP